jgi:hypothetical protein
MITSMRSARLGGETPERDPARPGQLVEQLGDGVGDRGGDRVDVEQVDDRHRLGASAPGWRRCAGW